MNEAVNHSTGSHIPSLKRAAFEVVCSSLLQYKTFLSLKSEWLFDCIVKNMKWYRETAVSLRDNEANLLLSFSFIDSSESCQELLCPTFLSSSHLPFEFDFRNPLKQLNTFKDRNFLLCFYNFNNATVIPCMHLLVQRSMQKGLRAVVCTR